LDAASTGYLTAALVIVQGVIEVLNSTILIATYPMMSRYYAERGEMFGFIVEKLALFTAIVTFPAALVLLLFAPDLTIPLFGQDFAPAADVLRLLMVYGVAAMLVNVFAQGMMVQNRQRRLLVYRVGGLVINLTVNGVLLALGYGIIGLVIGSAIAESVVLALLLWTFRENGLLMPRLLAGITRLLAVSAVTLAIMAFVGQWGAWAGIIGGAVIYLGGVLRGGILRADDWDLLYRLVSAMPGGAWFGRFLPKPA
jgi:O-antigen/teichoic acid export membrane protein